MFGKERRLKTLGKWPSLSLREARSQAKVILATPTKKNRHMSFSEARDAFLADCAQRLRKSTADRYYFALKDITAHSLDTVSTDFTDPTQLKSLKAFYNWCIDRELTDRNPFARRKVIFDQRDRLLSDEEIAAIWKYERSPYSDIVKLLILTGQRRAQIAKFDPEWIDGGFVNFPASIMKSKRVHTIPVTPQMLQLLNSISPYAGWSKGKVRIDKHTGVSGWVLHVSTAEQYQSSWAA